MRLADRMGMTLSGVEHLMSRLLSAGEKDLEKFLPEVIIEKSQILKKESCLEFVPIKQTLDQINFYHMYKYHLQGWTYRKNIGNEHQKCG